MGKTCIHNKAAIADINTLLAGEKTETGAALGGVKAFKNTFHFTWVLKDLKC